MKFFIFQRQSLFSVSLKIKLDEQNWPISCKWGKKDAKLDLFGVWSCIKILLVSPSLDHKEQNCCWLSPKIQCSNCYSTFYWKKVKWTINRNFLLVEHAHFQLLLVFVHESWPISDQGCHVMNKITWILIKYFLPATRTRYSQCVCLTVSSKSAISVEGIGTCYHTCGF